MLNEIARVVVVENVCVLAFVVIDCRVDVLDCVEGLEYLRVVDKFNSDDFVDT